jgi:Recombination endonuclease VII
MARNSNPYNCRDCNCPLTIDNTFPAKGNKTGRDYICKDCKHKKHMAYLEKNKEQVKKYLRYRNIARKYGLTEQEFTTLLDSQNGTCAICKATDGGKYGFAVDHNHDTGAVRGILCISCNTGLGRFGDSLPLLETAATYLRRHEYYCKDKESL